MFDKFGEMGSAEELNTLAANLRAEGDFDSIRDLAKENGLEGAFAQAFIDGELDFLCDTQTAAFGKIEVEAAKTDLKNCITEDWVEYIKAECMRSDEMAAAVRKKGKDLPGCIAKLLTWSFSNQKKVPPEVVKAAKINGARVTLGIPNMAQAKRIIREYYLGGDTR
ncbi:MAG: hypothetical protein IJJ38_01035 [Lachnospiraceae bacterium]|nr:hypothetical protein [Lachnospiraceae bacterium]